MKVYIRQSRRFFLLLGLCLFTLLYPGYVFADSRSADNNSSAGFYVQAVIPENQRDKSLTYFDLFMQPNARQTLTIQIINEGDETIHVSSSAISASTSSSGLIDYKTPDIWDETLRYPFSELADIRQPDIAIPPGSSMPAEIDVTMPPEPFDGVILGGIVITRVDEIDKNTDNVSRIGSTIYNDYSYIVGVKLSETETAVDPTFEILSVSPEAVDYRPAIVHYLRNREAAIVKNMDVRLAIHKTGQSEAVLHDQWTIDMAPNSVIKLPSYNELSTGNYESTLTLSTGDNTTVLHRSFSVTAEKIRKMETETMTEKVAVPFWVWLIVSLLALLIISVFTLCILVWKRRKKEKDSGKNSPEKEID